MSRSAYNPGCPSTGEIAQQSAGASFGQQLTHPHILGRWLHLLFCCDVTHCEVLQFEGCPYRWGIFELRGRFFAASLETAVSTGSS